MTSKKALLLSLTVLILATLACKYLPPRTPTPEPEPSIPAEDVIATSVAATIIAGGGEAPTAEVPTEEVPTEEATPEPPSFLRIAFVKDGDVWYWEEGGAAAQITTLGDVISVYISSDGLVAAFIRQHDWNNEEIYAVNTDGTNVRPLVTLADFASMVSHKDAISAVPYRIAWVPGTHTLAFNTRLTFEGPGLILPDELRLVDADTVTLSVLMPPGTAGDFYYSPDGSQIALVNGTMISVVDSAGGNRRDVLTFPSIMTYSEYQLYPPVVWSADGSFLRAAIPPHDPLAVPEESTTIWHLPADGTPPSTLTTLIPVPFFHENVLLSPETSRIAYLAMVTPGAPPIVDLHIANVDGSGDVIYDSGDRSFEAWSTDGEHFIFTEAGHNPKVGRLGDPPLALTGITLMLNISWVDETRFLYLNRLSGSWELWLRELGTPGMLLASTTGDIIRYDFVK
jgi:Tol biopolymer transport system component